MYSTIPHRKARHILLDTVHFQTELHYACLISLTGWVRRRLRAALWRQWKTPRRRRAALIALGVGPRAAANTADSGHGPWYLARSRALSVGLSKAYFRSLGLPSLIEER